MLLLSPLLLSALLLVSGAPAPQPGSVTYKQTTRDEIIARQISPLRKRNSGLSYPACSTTSTDYDAAVYEGNIVSIEQDDVLGYPTVTSFKGCLDACKANPECNGGGYYQSGTYYSCTIAKKATIVKYNTVGSSPFVFNTDCAANSGNVDSSLPCCNV